MEEVGKAREYAGKDNDPGVLVYPIPYLEPDLVRTELSDDNEALERTHQAVMDAALRRIGNDLLARRNSGDMRPAIVMAHAFIVGAAPSDSERNIEVGGVASVSAQTFETFGGAKVLPEPGLSYVALGHLHRPQEVLAARVPMRYSGSPIAYSFSEAPGDKSAVVIDTLGAEGNKAVDVSLIDIPTAHPLVVLRGSMESLLEGAKETLPQAYVSLTVTDDSRPQEMVARLRAVYPHALSILHSPAHVSPLRAPRIQLETVDMNATLAEFFQQAGGQSLTERERTIVGDVIDAVKGQRQ